MKSISQRPCCYNKYSRRKTVCQGIFLIFRMHFAKKSAKNSIKTIQTTKREQKTNEFIRMAINVRKKKPSFPHEVEKRAMDN